MNELRRALTPGRVVEATGHYRLGECRLEWTGDPPRDCEATGNRVRNEGSR